MSVSVHSVLLVAVLSGGCAGAKGPTMPSQECTVEYAEMVAIHTAELVNACLGEKDPDACVQNKPEIDAEADRRFVDWQGRCLK